MFVLRPPRKLRWQSRTFAPGVRDLEYEIIVAPLGPNRAQVVQRARYEGLLARLRRPARRRRTASSAWPRPSSGERIGELCARARREAGATTRPTREGLQVAEARERRRSECPRARRTVACFSRRQRPSVSGGRTSAARDRARRRPRARRSRVHALRRAARDRRRDPRSARGGSARREPLAVVGRAEVDEIPERDRAGAASSARAAPDRGPPSRA